MRNTKRAEGDRRQTGIFLPKYVGEGDRVLNTFLPLCAFESKERFSVALGNRGQLKKVARNHQLQSAPVDPTLKR